MQTFLILSSNQIFIDNKIEEFVKNFKIGNFDKIVISPQNSISIDDVKNVIRMTANKPFSENRLIIINSIQSATPQAQNALLKFLEESKENQIVLLTAPSVINILPTVISRSEIIRDLNSKNKSGVVKSWGIKSINELLIMSRSKRLSFITQNITSKED